MADVPGSGDVQRLGVFWIATNPEQTSEGNLQLRRGASSELVVGDAVGVFGVPERGLDLAVAETFADGLQADCEPPRHVWRLHSLEG